MLSARGYVGSGFEKMTETGGTAPYLDLRHEIASCRLKSVAVVSLQRVVIYLICAI